MTTTLVVISIFVLILMVGFLLLDILESDLIIPILSESQLRLFERWALILVALILDGLIVWGLLSLRSILHPA